MQGNFYAAQKIPRFHFPFSESMPLDPILNHLNMSNTLHHTSILLTKFGEAVTLPPCIREVTSLNPGRDTEYTN
jgi:hypothetical protein